MLKHEHIPFGSFTDSLIMTLSAIGDLITGDLNLNMQNDLSAHKFDSLCEQLSIVQSIEEPTHLKKKSSSLTNVLLVNNNDHLILCGVGDPFCTKINTIIVLFWDFLTFINPNVYLLNVAYRNTTMVIVK